jgi:hypothetical protein
VGQVGQKLAFASDLVLFVARPLKDEKQSPKKRKESPKKKKGQKENFYFFHFV